MMAGATPVGSPLSRGPDRMSRSAVLSPPLVWCCSLFSRCSSALPPRTFDKAEFAARRAKLLARIPDGIAVVLGGIEHPYPVRFRQSPDFYYLTGLKEPGTVLVLNGVTKNAAVFALKRPEFGGPERHAAAARRGGCPAALRHPGAADGELLHLPQLRGRQLGGEEALPPAHAARRADPRAVRGPDLRRRRRWITRCFGQPQPSR